MSHLTKHLEGALAMPMGQDVDSELGHALSTRNDEWILNAVNRSSSHADFYKELQRQLGFLSYEGTVSSFGPVTQRYSCALVMVPVIMPAGLCGLVGSADALDPIIRNVRQQLLDWFDFRVEVSMYSALIGYAEVCTWTPCVMRDKLEQLSMRTPTSAAPATCIALELPADAPVLAFYTAVVHRPLAWTGLPQSRTDRDLEFTARMAGTLALCAGRLGPEMRPRVALPQLAADAITSGATSWIEALHCQYRFDRWNLEHIGAGAAVLHLECSEPDPFSVGIPLLAHQMGLDGIQKVLNSLAACEARTADFTRH
jgi:hypothetical protein